MKEREPVDSPSLVGGENRGLLLHNPLPRRSGAFAPGGCQLRHSIYYIIKLGGLSMVSKYGIIVLWLIEVGHGPELEGPEK